MSSTHTCSSYFSTPVFKVHHWLNPDFYELVVFWGREPPKNETQKKKAIADVWPSGDLPEDPQRKQVVFVNARLFPDDSIERVYQKCMLHIPTLANAKKGTALYAWIHRSIGKAAEAYLQAFLIQVFRNRLLIPTQELTQSFEHFYGKAFPHTRALSEHRQVVDLTTAYKLLDQYVLSLITQPLGIRYQLRGYDAFPKVDLLPTPIPTEEWESEQGVSAITGMEAIVDKTMLLENYGRIEKNTLHLVSRLTFGDLSETSWMKPYFVPDYDFTLRLIKGGPHILHQDAMMLDFQQLHKREKLHSIVPVQCRMQYAMLRCHEAPVSSGSAAGSGSDGAPTQAQHPFQDSLRLDQIFQQFRTTVDIPFVFSFHPVENHAIKVYRPALVAQTNLLTVDTLQGWLDFKKHRLQRHESYLLFKIWVSDPGLYVTLILYASGSYDLKFYATADKILLFSHMPPLLQQVHLALDRLNRLPACKKRLQKDGLTEKLFLDTFFTPRLCRIVNMVSMQVCPALGPTVSVKWLAEVMKEMHPYFSVVGMTADRLQVIYKRVGSFGRPSEITAFIYRNRQLEAEEIVGLLQKQFSMSEDDAREAFEIWASSSNNSFAPWFRRTQTTIRVNIRTIKNVEYRWVCDGITSMAQHKRLIGLMQLAIYLASTYATQEQLKEAMPVLKMSKATAKAVAEEQKKEKQDMQDTKKKQKSRADVYKVKAEDDTYESYETYDDFGDYGDFGDFGDMDDVLENIQLNIKTKNRGVPSPEASPEPTPATPSNPNQGSGSGSRTDQGGVSKVRPDAKLGTENPMLKELRDADPGLFAFKSKADSKGWASTCGHSPRRQPVVITANELARIRKADAERGEGPSLTTALAYGSTPELRDRNRYICPEIWCPKSRMSLSLEQEAKHGCPLPDETPISFISDYFDFEPGTDPTTQQPIWVRTNKIGKGKGKGKDKSNNSLLIKRFPGYIEKGKHPEKTFCLPCCFKIQNKKKDLCENGWNQPKETDDYRMGQQQDKDKDKDKEKEKDKDKDKDKEGNTENPKKKKESGERYVLDDIPVMENRYGILPPLLGTLLGNVKCGLHTSSAKNIGPGSRCFLRRGINIDGGQPFLTSVLNLLDDPSTIAQAISKIKQHVTPHVFLMLNGGHLVRQWMPADIDRRVWDTRAFQSFKSWFLHDTRKSYRALYDLKHVATEIQNKTRFPFTSPLVDAVHREFAIYQSYTRFMELLDTPTLPKTHSILLDLFQIQDPEITPFVNPKNIQFILIEYASTSSTSIASMAGDITVECPAYRHPSEVFDPNRPVALLFKYGNFYEPIYRVASVRGHLVPSKTLPLSEEKELQALYQYMLSSCKKYGSAQAARPIAQTLRAYLNTNKHGFKSYVIDYNFRVVGLLTADGIYLPLPVSENIYTPPGAKETIQYIDHVLLHVQPAKGIQRSSVLKLLKALNEIVQFPAFPVSPSKSQSQSNAQAAQIGKEAMILLDNGFFIPLKKLARQHSLLEPMLDEKATFLKKDTVDARVRSVHALERDAQLYHVFKTEVLRIIPYHSPLVRDLHLLWHPMHPFPESLKKQLLQKSLQKIANSVVIESVHTPAVDVSHERIQHRQLCTRQLNQTACQDTLHCAWIDQYDGKVKKGSICRVRIPSGKLPGFMQRLVDDIWMAKSFAALQHYVGTAYNSKKGNIEQHEDQLFIDLPSVPKDPSAGAAATAAAASDSIQTYLSMHILEALSVLHGRNQIKKPSKEEVLELMRASSDTQKETLLERDTLSDLVRVPAMFLDSEENREDASDAFQWDVLPDKPSKLLEHRFRQVIPTHYSNEALLDLFVKASVVVHGNRSQWTVDTLKKTLHQSLLRKASTSVQTSLDWNARFQYLQKKRVVVQEDAEIFRPFLEAMLNHPDYVYGQTELMHLAHITDVHLLILGRVSKRFQQDFLRCLHFSKTPHLTRVLLLHHVHAAKDNLEYYHPVIELVDKKYTGPASLEGMKAWVHDFKTLPPVFAQTAKLKCTESSTD